MNRRAAIVVLRAREGTKIDEKFKGNRVSRSDNEDNRSVALYWDFENIHAGLAEAKFGDGFYSKPDSRFKPQDPLVDIQAIVDLGFSFGPIAINRAYCNWQYFGRYRDTLLQNAIELIQLFPPGASAKNGADIKLCLDAADDIGRFGHIGTIIVIGGDSDFMPLAQRIKAAGRTLIGVGTLKSTNRHWAKSCHEFRYYENLIEKSETAAAIAPATPADPAADILRRALRLLSETQGDIWVNKASIWPMIKRLDPTFNTKDYGQPNFAALVKALVSLVEVR